MAMVSSQQLSTACFDADTFKGFGRLLRLHLRPHILKQYSETIEEQFLTLQSI